MPKKVYSIRLDTELAASVDQLAEQAGLDRTTLVSRLMQLLLQGDIEMQVGEAGPTRLTAEHLASDWQEWIDERVPGDPDHHIDALDFSSLSEDQKRSAKVRIEAKVSKDPTTGCWNWCGYLKDDDSYGTVSVGGKVHRVHRASYALYVGPSPAGMHIRHLCANRQCVNPAHLSPGTPTENQRDYWKQRRSTARLAGQTVTSDVASAFPDNFKSADVGKPLSEVFENINLNPKPKD